MSADSIQISTNPQLYDLSESPGKVYGSELKLLKTGLYGLFAGDSNYDGTIDSTDFGLFSIAGSGAVYGYAVSDYNLDGYVTAFDFNLFAPNRKAGITTHIITNLILKK